MGPASLDLGYYTATVERARDKHAKNLVVIVKGASGVEDEIWDANDSLGYERLVAIGNAIRAEDRFVGLIRQADTDRHDGTPPHPAVKANQTPSTDSPHANLHSLPWGIADRTWPESCYRRYGLDSLWVRSHVRAEIPEVSSDIRVPPQWLDYATSIQRLRLPTTHPVHKTGRIAIDPSEDVGRYSTSHLVRDDYGILECDAGNSLSLADAAEEAARLVRAWNIDARRVSYHKLGKGRDFRTILSGKASETPSARPAVDGRETGKCSSTKAPRRPGS